VVEGFFSRGWVRFPADPVISAWSANARETALKVMTDPALAHWWECEDTWFIGVDALPNDATGRLQDGPPLGGSPVEFIARNLGPLPRLHKAQLSVVRPGYPRPRTGEDDGAFRYRLKRDGAHVDGVKRIGHSRRRAIEEPHAWVLGLPVSFASADASPLVVWEGSHEIMRAGLAAVLAGHDSADWPRVDVTDAYNAARKKVFQSCERVCVHAVPGEAYLMHRLTLHGVAPWARDACASHGGRMIAYFRPEEPDMRHWLTAP
jgi:hypothetical protein